MLQDSTNTVSSSEQTPRQMVRPLDHMVRAEIPRLDRIILAFDERQRCLLIEEQFRYRPLGVVVEDRIAAYERVIRKQAINTLAPRRYWFLVTQRLVGVIVAALGLILCGPLMVVIALLIKLDSRGPVFFRQIRCGLHGRPFDLIKLRTMQVLSDGAERTFWEADNEDRITRLGRWLRPLHIDELPQLFSVLRGDMNLIGPRPHPVANAAVLRERLPYYRLRELVRPGVTGWAQVCKGYANGLEEETEKLRYDLYYIQNISLRLDFRILAETVRTVSRAFYRLRQETALRHHAAPASKITYSPAKRSAEMAAIVAAVRESYNAAQGPHVLPPSRQARRAEAQEIVRSVECRRPGGSRRRSDFAVTVAELERAPPKCIESAISYSSAPSAEFGGVYSARAHEA